MNGHARPAHELLRAHPDEDSAFRAAVGAMLDKVIPVVVGRSMDDLIPDVVVCREVGGLSESDLETALDTVTALTAGLSILARLRPDGQASAAEALKRLLDCSLLDAPIRE